MKFIQWQWPKKLAALLEIPAPDPSQQTARIVAMQRNIVLPVRAMVTGVVLYYLFYSRWLAEVATTQGVVLETLQNFFVFYVLFQAGAASLLLIVKRYRLGLIQWLVFTIGLLDGLLYAGLALVTGGFESVLFWVFPGLIVINALSIPLATPQLVLNLLLSAFYLGAGMLNANISENESTVPQIRAGPITSEVRKAIASGKFVVMEPPAEAESGAEPFLLRLSILWLTTLSCYGVRALLEKQRQVDEEAQEFAARQEQLGAAGRLAAEIAHQMKNPLGIINNAAFSLQRALREGTGEVAQQIQIIQEEVERSDRIITQLIGYAQLSEGRVEKLSVTEELERAIGQVFPRGAQYETQIQRDYADPFPPLLMQRAHLIQVFVNLLQNAREVLHGRGNIYVSARCRPDYSIEVVIRDDGPGIAGDKLGMIFEAYFTNKVKGTGLGLAIVKHNVELYGGTVRVESELGKGARFVLLFPAKIVPRLGP
jgi:signal transduction histidine kinase